MAQLFLAKPGWRLRIEENLIFLEVFCVAGALRSARLIAQRPLDAINSTQRQQRHARPQRNSKELIYSLCSLCLCGLRVLYLTGCLLVVRFHELLLARPSRWLVLLVPGVVVGLHLFDAIGVG